MAVHFGGPCSIEGSLPPIQIADEELKLHLEDSDSLMEHLDMLLNECMEDFPEDDKSTIAEYAAKIARASITEQTRTGHARCVQSN